MRTWILNQWNVFDAISYTTGEGNGNPLQYSCLENPVDRGAWWAAVHEVAQSQTWLKRLSMHHALEKEMATHPSIPAWRIPGREEPGGLLSIGSHWVVHDWSDLAAAAAAAYTVMIIDSNPMLPFYSELWGRNFSLEIVYLYLTLMFSLFPTSNYICET